MYSHEIRDLLAFRNYIIFASEYMKAFNTYISTQIVLIRYDKDHNNFFAKTNDGYEFHFKVIPDKVYMKNK